MSDVNEQTLQTPTEVIALPPLRMVLVHGLGTTEDPKHRNRDGQVDSRAVKKLIAHLQEKKRPQTNVDED
jgi:hypothetical protein